MAWSDRRKRTIRRAVFGTCMLLVIGLVAAWIVAGMLVAPRPQNVGDPPSDIPAVSISFASRSGSKIAGWNIPSVDSKGVILLLHGIRGSRLSMLERARLLHSAGYSILMIDLQAHGESPGKRITIGYREQHDVRAAVQFARKQYPAASIGIIGVSLGGASALLASPLDIDALILESVYPNIQDAIHNRVAEQLGPLSFLPAELLLLQLKPRFGIWPSELRPCDNIPNAECPLYLISGLEDHHTTPQETEQMFSTAQEPKELWLVEGAAHEDLLSVSPLQYKLNVLRFLNQHMIKSH